MSDVWDIPVKHTGEVNHAKLDEELRAAIGGVIGASSGWYGVRVHLGHEPTAAEVKAAETVVQNHDPNKLTAEQQALQTWKSEVAAISAKSWDTLTAAERDKALRLQHEQMIYQETGKLPPRRM